MIGPKAGQHFMRSDADGWAVWEVLSDFDWPDLDDWSGWGTVTAD